MGSVFGAANDSPGRKRQEYKNNDGSSSKVKNKPTSDQLTKIGRAYLNFTWYVFNDPKASSNSPRIKSLFVKDLTIVENDEIFFKNDHSKMFPQMEKFKPKHRDIAYNILVETQKHHLTDAFD